MATTSSRIPSRRRRSPPSVMSRSSPSAWATPITARASRRGAAIQVVRRVPGPTGVEQAGRLAPQGNRAQDVRCLCPRGNPRLRSGRTVREIPSGPARQRRAKPQTDSSGGPVPDFPRAGASGPAGRCVHASLPRCGQGLRSRNSSPAPARADDRCQSRSSRRAGLDGTRSGRVSRRNQSGRQSGRGGSRGIALVWQGRIRQGAGQVRGGPRAIRQRRRRQGRDCRVRPGLRRASQGRRGASPGMVSEGWSRARQGTGGLGPLQSGNAGGGRSTAGWRENIRKTWPPKSARRSSTS